MKFSVKYKLKYEVLQDWQPVGSPLAGEKGSKQRGNISVDKCYWSNTDIHMYQYMFMYMFQVAEILVVSNIIQMRNQFLLYD